MPSKTYCLKKIEIDYFNISNKEVWQGVNELIIENYLWMKNDYHPKVIVKVCYSNEFIFLKFVVYEQKVTARYIKVGDPVFKDSCVEIFINLFPEETQEYFNIELNAIGTIKMGYGIKRNRSYLKASDLIDLKVITTIKKPVIGFHRSDSWELYCKIPFKLLEKYSHRRFEGKNAIGNFYKCGDETEYKHYGMWNFVDSPTPDFHLPEYFGNLIFSK